MRKADGCHHAVGALGEGRDDLQTVPDVVWLNLPPETGRALFQCRESAADRGPQAHRHDRRDCDVTVTCHADPQGWSRRHFDC
jgi:hypothetical protein